MKIRGTTQTGIGWQLGEGVTRCLAAMPAGEVDMGDGLEDEEADCYHLNAFIAVVDRGHEVQTRIYPIATGARRRSELGYGISKIGSIIG
jgi:hypothetical protein